MPNRIFFFFYIMNINWVWRSLQEKDVFLWALPRSDRIVIQLSFFLFILVYLFCMLDSTSCITYVEMLRVCNASIEL